MRFNEDGFEISETGLDRFEVDQEVTLTCIPKRELMYKSDKGGFAIYLCDVAVKGFTGTPENFKMSGNFIVELDLGQTYEVKGSISEFSGKKQLRKSEIKKIHPVNSRGVISLLEQLPGLGHLASVLYDDFGDDSVNMILSNPDKVVKTCPAFYPELVVSWQNFLSDIKDDQGILMELINLGLKPYQAKKLFDIYKEKVIDLINANPYFLAKEIQGYSFLRCDQIAKQVGFDPKSPLRIHEGIMTVLNDCTHEGHTYLPEKDFIDRSIELLKIRLTVNEMKAYLKMDEDEFEYLFGDRSFTVNRVGIEESLRRYESARYRYQKQQARYVVVDFTPEDISQELSIMQMERRVVIDENRIYSEKLFESENQVAFNLSRIVSNEKQLSYNTKDELNDYLEKKGIKLENKQEEAVLVTSGSKGGFTIIDGSAGCGKTFTLKIALDIIEKQYLKFNNYFEVLILAPTGKAAQVASSATGLPAYTVHRALGGNSIEGFFYNARNPLPYDCIVLDESSMLDILLAKGLFEAISPDTKVIFLGDTKQLPSVGPGNVLRDLIESGRVNVITLDVVKRQGKDSGILKNANNIVEKRLIETQQDTNDALVVFSDNDSLIQKQALSIASKLKRRFSLEDIQVLCPQRNGMVGVNTMNYFLQKLYNPGNNENKFLSKNIQIVNQDESSERVDMFFKKNDKVMHIRNNYTLPWYKLLKGKLVLDDSGKGLTNGECGIIVQISTVNNDGEKNEIICVKFDNKFIIYRDDFSDLEHAYAMTIHKSQGSEWKGVIIPISMSNRVMLENNLIYTAYTRTKTLSAVIANKDALTYCIQNERSINRFTGLSKRIKSYR